MNTNTTTSPARHRAWPVLLLALPAFVAIWSGWVGLGGLTGFGMVTPLPGIWDSFKVNSAITLPVGVETYAAYALNIWLTGGVGDRAARFAKWSALGSLFLGAGGQVAYHLMIAEGMTEAPWQITAVVACLPVAVLGMGAALAHLVSATESTEATPDVAPVAEAAPVLDPAPGYQVDADARVTPVDLTTAVEPAPTPAPRAPARRTTTTRSGGTSTAAKVARLREQHPDWTLPQIAERAGCSVRTVRRHLNTPTTPDGVTAPAEPLTADVAA